MWLVLSISTYSLTIRILLAYGYDITSTYSLVSMFELGIIMSYIVIHKNNDKLKQHHIVMTIHVILIINICQHVGCSFIIGYNYIMHIHASIFIVSVRRKEWAIKVKPNWKASL